MTMPELSASVLGQINPGLIVIAAGVLLILTPRARPLQALCLIGGPVLAALALLARAGDAPDVSLTAFGLDLIVYRVDPLSRIFALAFLLAALLGGIYSLHRHSPLQDSSSLIYAGAAIGAVCVGDLISLFVFWELTALSSTALILAPRTPRAYRAGLRYLVIHIGSGLLLLAATSFLAASGGSVLLPGFNPAAPSDALDPLADPAALMLLIAFGIKAAFPLLHNWLQDSYPAASETGAVMLSAFTTKLAVYALARCFPGVDTLIVIGAVMTVFPVFFAVIENDLRKVLAYSLNNQVGFMVCAIGIGTPLAINGAALHAFVHIIYKALLFMSMGAVLLRTGTTRASDLGGLWRSMPMSALFCIIGAASIAAFPLFSGFVAKSLTMSAVAGAGLGVIWAMLLFASAGVMEHSGIKIPWCAFFGPDRGLRPKEAPANMLTAMALASVICILAGVWPSWLYALAPYPVEAFGYLQKSLWTAQHVVEQLQLLVFAALAFVILKRTHLYPEEQPSVILDSDWLYRRPGHSLIRWADAVSARIEPALMASTASIGRSAATATARLLRLASRTLGPAMTLWTIVFLGVILVVVETLS